MLIRISEFSVPSNIDRDIKEEGNMPSTVYLVVGPNGNVFATSTSYAVAAAIGAALLSLFLGNAHHKAEADVVKLTHDQDYVFGMASWGQIAQMQPDPALEQELSCSAYEEPDGPPQPSPF